jgi:energy-coupling factor transport system ATP-binding protein
MASNPPSVEIDHLTFYHSGREKAAEPALRDLSLRIEPGEFVALVGANGSGKTTLVRHLNALLLPTSGSVRVLGMDTREQKNWPAIRSSVGMVFQSPEDQLVSTTVEDDTAFGAENAGLPSDEIRRRVDEALRAVDMWAERKRPPHLLSAGQMQRVALAGVLAMRPRCIVFDETTAQLDPAGRRNVIEMMQRLNREGMTILYITHFMQEALLAHRVVVLSRGQVAMDDVPRIVFSDPQRLSTLGLELPPLTALAEGLQSFFPALPAGVLTPEELANAIPDPTGAEMARRLPAAEAHPQRAVAIDVSHLEYVYMRETPLAHTALEDVTLSAGQGAVHGLIGATGSGKSTFLQHFNGLLRPQKGSVEVAGHLLNDPKVTVKQMVQIVGLVFQNPEAQFVEQYIGDEIAYGPRPLLSRQALRERVQWAMQWVGLDFDLYKDRLTYSLSGGERRKVALASVLALQPQVLVLDEPTAGLDPLSRREVLRRLQDFQRSGMTLVLSSHQMGDLARLTERVTVLHEGRDVRTGTAAEIFSEGQALHDWGLEAPIAVQVADRLRARGWPVPREAITTEGLVAAMAGLTAKEAA